MPKNKCLKLVIDTNLWISFVISNNFAQLEYLLIEEKARIILSDELIDELQETITKPKLRKYFRGDALSDLLKAFDPFVDFIEVKSTVVKCRDPKDDFLLALAKDGKADYLLTGDADLLEIEKYGKTVISTMTLFLNTHGKDS